MVTRDKDVIAKISRALCEKFNFSVAELTMKRTDSKVFVIRKGMSSFENLTRDRFEVRIEVDETLELYPGTTIMSWHEVCEWLSTH